MANAYTTGKRDRMDPAQKDKIRAEMMMQRMVDCAEGKIELTTAQVSAAKVVLDKVKPSLQAIQQSTEDPWADKSEDELLESVVALITSQPQLLARVRAALEPVRPVLERGMDDTNAVQHGVSGQGDTKQAA